MKTKKMRKFPEKLCGLRWPRDRASARTPEKSNRRNMVNSLKQYFLRIKNIYRSKALDDGLGVPIFKRKDATNLG
ncbi:hypothetical protein RclHR1_01520022 [Rhizophagus clarus]|uniref:Uncharacterized protein n=1 Tax=Rhizophagus clarus TaxID=94130 RepID=A0A2Z6QEL7_9GLOM|nr:hypothetical protein RclHR1_01520022 [Rhizophagus clarus]GES78713.1 hypothetical protein RCL_e2950_RclHR1_01520022 [Rhizophagus clarus]